MKIIRNKTINNQSGITLIALVITIIVLLILAGVAISMLAGDNGILRQAASAKKNTDEQSTIEQIKLAATAAMTNEEHKIKKTKDIEDELKKYFKEYTISGNEEEGWTVTTNGVTYVVASNGTTRKQNDIEKLKSEQTKMKDNMQLIDENGDTITIPKNFNISRESPTTVTKGMVVEDCNKNQYVWIPIFEKTDNRKWGVDYTKVKSKDDWQNIENALINTTDGYTKTYKNTSYRDVWFGKGEKGLYGYYNGTEFVYYSNGNMTKEEYETLYRNMLKSVYKNGGFYIGRYEMGIDVVTNVTEAQNITRINKLEYSLSNATDTSTKVVENGDPSIAGMQTPISKANAVPYNYITQSQAQMLAKKLEEGRDYSNVSASITFGVQWDAVCVFIEKYDKNNTATNKSEWLKRSEYGKLWGNYYNATFNMEQGFYNSEINAPIKWKNYANKTEQGHWLCTTGASKQNCSLNIYDFAGNFQEWTLEMFHDPQYPCAFIGGFSLNNFAAYRFFSSWTAQSTYSARTALYIK